MTTTRRGPHHQGVSRRTLLRTGTAAGLGIVFAGSIEALAGCAPATPRAVAAGPPTPIPAPAGYGPLVADPKRILSLPAGFRYTVVAEAGVSTLSDGGEPTPSDTDGTAAFATGSGITLVNNHEIIGDEAFPVPVRDGLTYDPAAGGGTTNIELSATGERVREYVSVSGTVNNCAGGVTPWGTWLTCEETEKKAGTDGLTRDHGWVFEVSPVGTENPGNSAEPLTFLGRYAHEAVAIDPVRNAVYLTEDATEPNGLLYRWQPPAGFAPGAWALQAVRQSAGDLAGTLQAMRCTPQRTARARPVRGHRAGHRASTSSGSTCRTGWPPRPPPACSSPTTRSPAAASSRARPGVPRARTSWPVTRGSTTAVRRSTTGRSGSSSRLRTGSP